MITILAIVTNQRRNCDLEHVYNW